MLLYKMCHTLDMQRKHIVTSTMTCSDHYIINSIVIIICLTAVKVNDK